MLLLFVGGVMNLLWAAGIAMVVITEKLLPKGALFARMAGITAVAAGILIAFR